MYYIEVNSINVRNQEQPFQTLIKVVPTSLDIEYKLRDRLQGDQMYYVNILYQPLLWLLTTSPMYIGIKQFPSDFIKDNILLTVNEEIIFKFDNERKRKHFEKKIAEVLSKFIDRILK